MIPTRATNVKAKYQEHVITTSVRGSELAEHYVHFGATVQPSAGVVIALCGGPAFSCVEGGRPLSIPDNYDVVTLDYLGIGQNAKLNQPEQMSHESQAEAVSGIEHELVSRHSGRIIAQT